MATTKHDGWQFVILLVVLILSGTALIIFGHDAGYFLYLAAILFVLVASS